MSEYAFFKKSDEPTGESICTLGVKLVLLSLYSYINMSVLVFRKAAKLSLIYVFCNEGHTSYQQDGDNSIQDGDSENDTKSMPDSNTNEYDDPDSSTIPNSELIPTDMVCKANPTQPFL